MKMKKQNNPPQNWPAVKPNTPQPAGNDPATRNWIFRAYDGSDNLLKEIGIKDRTEDEARRECESYVEQSQTIEDWTLTPDPANEFKIGQTVYCNGKKDEVAGFVTPDDDENYAMGYRLILKDEGTQSFSAVSVTPPAGNDLPQQLTYDPFDDHDSFYFESTRLGNDYDFRIEWSEHFARKREALRDEIVRRYNDFPALQEQNRELLEALKFVSEVLPHLRPDKTLTGGDHFSLIGKIDNLKTIITKYSK